jgi:hypothetical protein
MKDLTDILKQAQDMQQRMADVQQQLEEAEVEGKAGGGLVTITMNGKGALRKILIDPSLVTADDVDVLEDLIVAAHTDAKIKVEAHAAEEMKKITGGLSMPPGFNLNI